MSNQAFHISPDKKRRPCSSPSNCAYGTSGIVEPMKNGSYYGVKVEGNKMDSIVSAWKDHVGEEDFHQMSANRQVRDNTADYHLTVIDPKEKRKLAKQGVNIEDTLKDVHVVPQGIGTVSDENGNQAWFVIAESTQADEIREELGLGEKDFHLTLGFKGKDVHGVPKDASTDVDAFSGSKISDTVETMNTEKENVDANSESTESDWKTKMEALQHGTVVKLEDLKPYTFEEDEDGNVVIPDEFRFKIQEEIDAGYVSRSISEDGRYVMLKYSKATMFDQHWNQVTINLRGVLTDTEHKVVYARGFTKFFNTSEHENRDGFENLPENEPVALSQKMDGSLGLVTHVDNENRVYTSGSALVYENEIASAGRSILADELAKRGQSGWKPPKNTTVLAEIIDPDVNPIVVAYDSRRLVVLGAVDNKTGRDVPLDELNVPLEHVGQINEGKPMSLAKASVYEVPSGEEGYVLEFQDSGLRAKVKSEDYLAAHKVMTSMSAKSVWESVSEGRDQELLDTVRKTAPDKAYFVLEAARDKITADANERLAERKSAVAQAFSDYGVSSLDEVSGDKMGHFVGHLRGYGSGKGDFSVDIQIAKGNEESAFGVALNAIKPKGNLSMVSLVSEEESEVGDDADDQI